MVQEDPLVDEKHLDRNEDRRKGRHRRPDRSPKGFPPIADRPQPENHDGCKQNDSRHGRIDPKYGRRSEKGAHSYRPAPRIAKQQPKAAVNQSHIQEPRIELIHRSRNDQNHKSEQKRHAVPGKPPGAPIEQPGSERHADNHEDAGPNDARSGQLEQKVEQVEKARKIPPQMNVFKKPLPLAHGEGDVVKVGFVIQIERRIQKAKYIIYEGRGRQEEVGGMLP